MRTRDARLVVLVRTRPWYQDQLEEQHFVKWMRTMLDNELEVGLTVSRAAWAA